MVHQLKLRFNYSADSSNLVALNEFTSAIFDFDFVEWLENGFWDPQYIPFSFFKNGKVVSNVSLYSMNMVVDGKRQKVAQICTCGTLPDYRCKGLAGMLLKKVIEFSEQNHKFIFFIYKRYTIVQHKFS